MNKSVVFSFAYLVKGDAETGVNKAKVKFLEELQASGMKVKKANIEHLLENRHIAVYEVAK